MQPITVLSLFDWMSCWRLALERAGIPVASYYASEIDKYAIQVSKKNYPSIIHIGDVSKCEYRHMSGSKKHQWYYLLGEPNSDPLCTNMRRTDIDLLIGGSPCQWLSSAGKGLNFEDPRSKLFFEFVRILNEAKPRYFLLENVKMKKERQNIISEHLFGIQPVEIDSALVSAQRRKRLYRVGERNEDWSYSQVEISQPEDKGIFLKDILQDKFEESYYINQDKVQNTNTKQSNFLKKILLNIHPSGKGMNGNVYNPEHKSPTLTTNKGEWIKIIQLPRGKNIWGIMENKTPTLSANLWQHNNLLQEWYRVRRLTPIECERLQTLPDDYTAGVSNTQRYKMLGNGRTVDVIAHIFREMFKD